MVVAAVALVVRFPAPKIVGHVRAKPSWQFGRLREDLVGPPHNQVAEAAFPLDVRLRHAPRGVRAYAPPSP